MRKGERKDLIRMKKEKIKRNETHDEKQRRKDTMKKKKDRKKKNEENFEEMTMKNDEHRFTIKQARKLE